MKPSFHVRQLNGPFGDPGLYVRLIREGRALMFDLGFTTSLTPKDILKISDIFVSHTHMDHFIGFDTILRISLKKEKPLNLYGPKGIVDCVEGKLKSYTWNIIEDYPLEINVSEVDGSVIRKAVFTAANSFRCIDRGSEPFNGVLLKDSFFSVKSKELDHQIPCLAFSLEEEFHINIDKSRLIQMDLSVGPWLGDLKRAIRKNRTGSKFNIEGEVYHYPDLLNVANITRGQKISYVVDAVGSKENMDKIISLARGSDVLYIETYFLDEDRDRARERYHLTAKEAGIIAREACVNRLEALHFSPKYMKISERLIEEAEIEFKNHN